MRQTVKNRMIKNVQMMAVGMMATASIMGTAAAMGVKIDNIPFNVLANPFQAVMTQGVAADEIDHGLCGNDATYVLDSDGTLTISGTGAIFYLGDDFTRPTLKEKIKNVIINEGITGIEQGMFEVCYNMKQITLPQTLEKIGDNAFKECQSLASIEMPQNVKQIGDSAFENCQGLSQVTLNEGLESIGSKAFSYTTLESVTIPGTVKKLGVDPSQGVNAIGTGPFAYCSNLKSVVIEEGVPYIGNQAFTRCKKLTSVSIPSSVTSIGGQTFQQCTNLASVMLPERLNFLGDYAFQSQGITQVSIPDDVTALNTSVFDCCTELETVQMGDNVTQIKDFAFRTCTGLKQIKLSDNINTIGMGAFNNCNKLESITLPSKLQYVGELAFASCETLKEVYIPDSTTYLGDRAFHNCNSMTHISGMEGIEAISKGTFGANVDYQQYPPYEETWGEPIVTTLDTTNEYVLNYDWQNNENRIFAEEPDLSPVEENWLYSSDDEAFITDKVQVGSVKDDFESLLDEFATVVGLDEKQGAKQNYETADASDEDTLVYCTKASDWIITIPKDLVMSGDDESRAEYVVGIYGNVDPAKRVTVTPAPSFEMTNTGNAAVKYNAQVNQAVTGINGMNIIESPEADVDDASQMSGTITANLKRAGSYRGTMTFTVDYVDHT